MTSQNFSVPVITIDGPGGSGKGTVSRALARHLGWHFLDSGALYRLVGLAAQRRGIALDLAIGDRETELAQIAHGLDVRFESDAEGLETLVFLEGEEVSRELRTERSGDAASRVAALPAVREALLERQYAFRKPPGLIADGRDMGSVVFPGAKLKIFLTASQQERAERRYKQLKDKGMGVNLNAILDEIVERDRRDSERKASPMKPAEDAIIIDTTVKSVDAVVNSILEMWQDVVKIPD